MISFLFCFFNETLGHFSNLNIYEKSIQKFKITFVFTVMKLNEIEYEIIGQLLFAGTVSEFLHSIETIRLSTCQSHSFYLSPLNHFFWFQLLAYFLFHFSSSVTIESNPFLYFNVLYIFSFLSCYILISDLLLFILIFFYFSALVAFLSLLISSNPLSRNCIPIPNVKDQRKSLRF